MREAGAVEMLSNGGAEMRLLKELLCMGGGKWYLCVGESGQIAPSPSDQDDVTHDVMCSPCTAPGPGTRNAFNVISHGAATKGEPGPQTLWMYVVVGTHEMKDSE